jgi:hypothetical protein
LYSIWQNMRQRCNNPKASYYYLYGGKGIKVTSEWNSYSLFREWAITNGYRDYLTLERKDGTKNYEPSNCRWADNNEQAANKGKRTKKVSQYIGVAPNKKGWQVNVTYKGIHTYLGTFADEREAALIRDAFIKNNKLPHKLNFEDTSCK